MNPLLDSIRLPAIPVLRTTSADRAAKVRTHSDTLNGPAALAPRPDAEIADGALTGDAARLLAPFYALLG